METEKICDRQREETSTARRILEKRKGIAIRKIDNRI
jgi:hypothetical protein